MGKMRGLGPAGAGQRAGRESKPGSSQKGVWHLPGFCQGSSECSVAWVARSSDLEEEPCELKNN